MYFNSVKTMKLPVVVCRLGRTILHALVHVFDHQRSKHEVVVECEINNLDTPRSVT